jgi:hypothetical protein
MLYKHIGYIGLDPVDPDDLTKDYNIYSLTINSIIFANVPSAWNLRGRACKFYDNDKNSKSINKVMYNFINEGAQHCAFADNGCASILHAANYRGSLDTTYPGGYLTYVAERIALFVDGTFTPQVQPMGNVLNICSVM